MTENNDQVEISSISIKIIELDNQMVAFELSEDFNPEKVSHLIANRMLELFNEWTNWMDSQKDNMKVNLND